MHPSPSLRILAIVHTALFAASMILAQILGHGGHYPSPFGPASDAMQYFIRNALAIQVSGALQFGAAIPLGIFAATAFSRLQFLGVRAAGAAIALFGGLAAASAMMMSGLIQWTLSQTNIVADPGVTRVLHLMSFATGGPGFAVPFGLLVAGVSLSGGLTRLLPRWVMIFGLVIAALAELSALALLTRYAAYLLPLARFPGFVWLIAAGVCLPQGRAQSMS